MVIQRVTNSPEYPIPNRKIFCNTNQLVTNQIKTLKPLHSRLEPLRLLGVYYLPIPPWNRNQRIR